MAYPINANDVMQVTIRGNFLNQVVMTTLHYRSAPGSPTIGNGSVALDNIFTQLDAGGGVLSDLANALPGNVGEITVDLQWIYPLRYRKQTYNPTVNIGQGDISTVTNLAAAITLQGEAANRRTVCTKHIPIAASNADSGLIDGGYRTILSAYVAEIQADIVAATHVYEPIIWGKPRLAYTKCGKDYPALPALRTDITGGFIQNTARVMRRRTVQLGI